MRAQLWSLVPPRQDSKCCNFAKVMTRQNIQGVSECIQSDSLNQHDTPKQNLEPTITPSCNSQQINLVSSPLYHLHTATCRDCRDSGDNFIGEIYSARAASQLYLPEWISDWPIQQKVVLSKVTECGGGSSWCPTRCAWYTRWTAARRRCRLRTYGARWVYKRVREPKWYEAPKLIWYHINWFTSNMYAYNW